MRIARRKIEKGSGDVLVLHQRYHTRCNSHAFQNNVPPAACRSLVVEKVPVGRLEQSGLAESGLTAMQSPYDSIHRAGAPDDFVTDVQLTFCRERYWSVPPATLRTRPYA